MKRPADFNRRAKLVADLATGRAREAVPTGRQLCGIARAARLSPERRREIARMGAAARWADRNGPREEGAPVPVDAVPGRPRAASGT